MKRAEDSPEAGGPCYTLYLEYLGGLVPILKGRRISKLRPEFVIMDPKMDSKAGGLKPHRLEQLLFIGTSSLVGSRPSEECQQLGYYKLNSIISTNVLVWWQKSQRHISQDHSP